MSELTPFRRIAAEAIVEQSRATQKPTPGYWMARCCRRCPEVAAAITWCDHEPGLSDNLLDQPFLDGRIGLDRVDPYEVWTRPRRPISQQQYEREVAWLRWAERNRPEAPELHPRRPLDRRTMAAPRFR